jgi:hypothetical protein
LFASIMTMEEREKSEMTPRLKVLYGLGAEGRSPERGEYPLGVITGERDRGGGGGEMVADGELLTVGDAEFEEVVNGGYKWVGGVGEGSDLVRGLSLWCGTKWRGRCWRWWL